MADCLNCEQALAEGARYCHACGQSTRILKPVSYTHLTLPTMQ